MALLTPVSKISSLKVKLANWLTKKQYGKEMTPMRVLYARRPLLMDVVAKILGKDKKLLLPKGFPELVRHFVAILNGCTFCQDISQANLMKEQAHTDNRLGALMDYKNSAAFSDAEKAALQWAENAVSKQEMPEETFREALKYWNEKQLIDLSFLAASESYMNIMNRSFGIESDNFCGAQRTASVLTEGKKDPA